MSSDIPICKVPQDLEPTPSAFHAEITEKREQNWREVTEKLNKKFRVLNSEKGSKFKLVLQVEEHEKFQSYLLASSVPFFRLISNSSMCINTEVNKLAECFFEFPIESSIDKNEIMALVQKLNNFLD